VALLERHAGLFEVDGREADVVRDGHDARVGRGAREVERDLRAVGVAEARPEEGLRKVVRDGGEQRVVKVARV